MPPFQFHADNIIPTGDWIWVFGSNEKGAHGKGAAKVARVNFRAEYGVGEGRTASAYAIPTKDKRLATLPLSAIEQSVQAFLAYAAEHPKLNFFVTRIGCGLAGYLDSEIAPYFLQAPVNCSLPNDWKHFVVSSKHRLIENSSESDDVTTIALHK